MDLKTYRGNLYKQTLSPDWSKTNMREAQQKFMQITDEVRRSLEDASALSQKVSPRTTLDPTSRQSGMDSTF